MVTEVWGIPVAHSTAPRSPPHIAAAAAAAVAVAGQALRCCTGTASGGGASCWRRRGSTVSRCGAVQCSAVQYCAVREGSLVEIAQNRFAYALTPTRTRTPAHTHSFLCALPPRCRRGFARGGRRPQPAAGDGGAPAVRRGHRLCDARRARLHRGCAAAGVPLGRCCCCLGRCCCLANESPPPLAAPCCTPPTVCACAVLRCVLAETSPARVRGLLISLKEAFIVGGILLG